MMRRVFGDLKTYSFDIEYILLSMWPTYLALVISLVLSPLTIWLGDALGYDWMPLIGAGFLFPGIVFSTIIGGFWSGVLSTLITFSYLYVTGDLTLVRFINIGIASILTVPGITFLYWYKTQMDTMNGHIKRIFTINDIIAELDENWGDYSDKRKHNVIGDILDKTSTLATLLSGWRALDKMTDDVKKQYEK